MAELSTSLESRSGSWSERLWLLSGVVAVGVLAFEAGLLYGGTRQPAPLVLEVPALPTPAPTQPAPSDPVLAPAAQTAPPGGNQTSEAADPKRCAFVGSRHSDKYHAPTCAVVKRIKPENVVCFASAEEAAKRGYTAGCAE